MANRNQSDDQIRSEVQEALKWDTGHATRAASRTGERRIRGGRANAKRPASTMRRNWRLLLSLAAGLALVFSVGCDEVEQAIAPDEGEWPQPNADYSNTRNTPFSEIDSSNVDELDVAWAFAPPGLAAFGAIAGAPLIIDDIVYFQDLGNNVFALDLETGEVIWQADFPSEASGDARSQATGPNGPAVGDGRVFVSLGELNAVAALDIDTGEVLWRQSVETQATQPLYADGIVYAFTTADGYFGGNTGRVYALDVETGEPRWTFQAVEEGFWGNPEINSGAGIWMPPALDSDGRMYLGTGNPAPFPGTVEFPSASSRPEPNLYANSLVVLDAESGELVWYEYVEPNDLFDLDFHNSPILIDDIDVEDETRNVVIGAGKNGKVGAWDRDAEELLWMTAVGIHQNDDLEEITPGELVEVYPGIHGGVETPMAAADGIVYAPVVNKPTTHEATGHGAADGNEALQASSANTPTGQGTGELVAIEIATGNILWETEIDSEVYGGATVVNDLVFTGTLDGTLYAFDRETGTEVWRYQAPAGVNAWPAVQGDTIIWGAGAGPNPQLLALRLGAEGVEFDGEVTPTPEATLGGTPTAEATHEDGEATPQNGNAAPSEVTLEISTPAGSQFDKDVLTAPAGAEVTVIYDNQSNIPHNIAFYLGDDGSAPLIARTEVEVGPVTQELTFTAPEEPGVYHFQCDPHAAIMFGDFIVE